MRVKLGDVVNRITGNEDRFNTDLKYYIGGEHYECGGLAIYEGGLLDSPEGNKLGFKFHFPFQKGDVLFMARNPHLRKAAQVQFDGICSDASYILRTKDNSVLLQDFLAIVVQSNSFWDFFEANKSGSVNYLMNWKELQNYEFELPDIESQHYLAKLVWGVEATRQQYRKLIKSTDELVKSQFIEMFGEHLQSKKTLSDVCIKGPQNGFYKKDAELCGNVPIIKMKQLFAYEAVGEADKCDMVCLSDKELEKFKLTEDDLVFGRRSLVVEGAGKCKRVGRLKANMVFESSLLRISLDRTLLIPRFLQLWLDTDDGKQAISSIRAVTTIAGIKGSDLGNIKVPIPPIKLQRQFEYFVQQADKSKFALQQSIEKLDALYKKIISENLG